MTSPTPGWYPDPHVTQQMRWWDGERWTDDTYERVEPVHDWTARPAEPQRAASAATTGAATTDDGAVLAGWWARAAARVLDLLLTGVLAWVVGFSQSRVFFTQVSDQFDAALRASENGGEVPPFQYDPATIKALTVISLVWLGVTLVYDLVFLLWRGATPGKLALGLRVRRWTPGERLTVGAVARRWLAFEAAGSAPYVGTFYLLLDVLWPLRDVRRRALHDRYAGTCVVRRR